MATPSPFASHWDEPRLTGREQTVRQFGFSSVLNLNLKPLPKIEEMYSVPESFLEIEVRNPQTHGKLIIQRNIVTVSKV
jgi:sorting nexin-3/12